MRGCVDGRGAVSLATVRAVHERPSQRLTESNGEKAALKRRRLRTPAEPPSRSTSVCPDSADASVGQRRVSWSPRLLNEGKKKGVCAGVGYHVDSIDAKNDLDLRS